MNVPFLDLRRAVEALRDDLDEAIRGVLDSGRFVLGEPVERFEAAFAGYCGVDHCTAVGSGTDAIALALRAVGVVDGDEVITAANTCVPTVAGIEGAGATPVLVDVDPQTFTLAPSELEQALTPRTRAILPVHLYGQCADMEPILAFAGRHDLKVVEDAAQAHGAAYRGRRAGALADAAAFSFYPTKNLGALGDGGAVTTADPDIAERVRLLRTYGERTRYDSVLRGTNSRLDTLQAAILLVKLPHLDRWTERRRSLASRYDDALGRSPAPVEADGRRHVYHLYVVHTPDRDVLRAQLAEAGVETLVHYPRAVHQNPAYRHLASEGRLDVSERLAREVLSIPLYPELTDEEVERVIECVFGAMSALASRS